MSDPHAKRAFIRLIHPEFEFTERMPPIASTRKATHAEVRKFGRRIRHVPARQAQDP